MKQDLHIGIVLEGRYKLLKLLGKGGMGEVYLGQHVTIGSPVAVKLLRTHSTGDDKTVQRFYREARATGAIKHKNIIDIMDVGTAPWGDPYMVMEYLEGESLGHVLKRTDSLRSLAAIGLIEPVLLALQAAHDKGIVHRDLKPDNIFIQIDSEGNPEVKLIDFGISKFSNGEPQADLTSDGALLGTPSYMSPEQARGRRDMDFRSDVFSMGVILYEMLMGKRPFVGENYNATLVAIMDNEPAFPDSESENMSEELFNVVRKALQKDPDNRYQSPALMLADIRELPDYDQCHEMFAKVADTIEVKTLAEGELGESIDTVQSQSDSSDDVVSATSPTRLVEGSHPLPASSKGNSSTKARSLTPAIIAIVVAIVVTGGVLWGGLSGFFSRTNDWSSGVTISVEGAPEGARIYFGDVLVPNNPFKVEPQDTIVTLRIEAAGFEPFGVAVTPSADRTVQVEMVALKRNGKGRKLARFKTLTNTMVQRVFNKNKKQVKDCFRPGSPTVLVDGGVAETTPVTGTMSLDIGPSGKVKDVTIAGPARSHPGLSKCLISVVSKWEFPRSVDGGLREIPVSFAQ